MHHFPSFLRTSWRVCAVTLVLLLAWDASGLDLPLARLVGGAQGFAWRDQAALVLLAHEVPRRLAWVAVALLAWGVWRPWGFLRMLTRADRLQLVASVLLGVAAVALIKRASSSSCPWDLAEFGGVAQYVSHWAWGLGDGGGGHCFPAGHASAAFSFLAAWPVLARTVPRLAGRWLVAVLAIGLVLGLSQQLRGAHYMSHTLWSAWLCAVAGLAVEGLRRLGRAWRPWYLSSVEAECR